MFTESRRMFFIHRCLPRAVFPATIECLRYYVGRISSFLGLGICGDRVSKVAVTCRDIDYRLCSATEAETVVPVPMAVAVAVAVARQTD